MKIIDIHRQDAGELADYLSEVDDHKAPPRTRMLLETLTNALRDAERHYPRPVETQASGGGDVS